MKRILFGFAMIFSTSSCLVVKAQNMPVATDLSLVPTPTLVTLPTAYNAGANVGTSLADPQQPKINFTRTWMPQVPVSSTTGFVLTSPDVYKVVTKYFNGWGNTMQVNKKGGLSSTKDVIVPVDNRASLTHTTFLPFTASKTTKFLYNPFEDQRTYYNTTMPAEAGTSYSQQVRPDNQSVRTTHSYSPGKSFVGQNVGTTTTVTWNVANEAPIMKYTGMQVLFDGYYGANQLKIKTTNGQHNSLVREFFDKDDKLVFKQVRDGGTVTNPTWITTEYIYDDFGRLTCIVPPKITFTSSYILINECYQFVYDKHDKIIAKYTPGMALWEYFVYDRKQRLVLYRSPTMGQDGKYKFTVYDNAGRIVLDGILSSTTAHTTWQNDIETSVSPTSGSLLYYLINSGNSAITSIPDCEILNRNYYDNYSVNFSSPGDAFDNSYSQYYKTGPGTVTPTPYKFVHGKLTRTESKVIDATNNNLGGDNYRITQYYYDQKGNLIQTRTCIPWYGSLLPTTTITMQYNFTGQRILEIVNTTGSSLGVTNSSKQQTLQITSYNYDINNGGRLNSIEQKLDNEAWRNIASFVYDDLGRVSRKVLGGIENQYYSFDIAGRLSAINKAYTEFGQGSNNMPTTFGVKLLRDYGFSIPRKDGKLSGIIWRGAGTAPMHAYGYEYDLAGRLAHAEFREYSYSTYISMYTQTGPVYSQGDNWNKQFKDYTASNMKYDKNGNMLSMNQVGVPIGGNQPVYIDVMAYFYGVGNRQTATEDAIPYNFHLDEFVNGGCVPEGGGPVVGGPEEYPEIGNKSDGSTYFDLGEPPVTPTVKECNDYEYDANGNLIHDGNKKIDITYNHFDLPVDITAQNTSGNNGNIPSTIHNVYNASGTLLRKVITDNTVDPVKVDKYEYVGAYVYRNDSLLYMLHPEGRAAYNAVNSTFSYDYFVKDHLGNVRTVITATETNGYDYLATYEIASANLESSLFAKINEVRFPNPDPGVFNTMAERLNGSIDSLRIGAALMLRVMPGDALELSADYYYELDTVQDDEATSANMMSSLLGTLTGGVGGYSGNEGPDATLFSTFTNNSGYYSSGYNALKDAGTDPSKPSAYLNYLVYDRNLNLISEQSGVLQIGDVQASWEPVALNGTLTLGQDGYVVIFTSNWHNQDVFFDKINVKFYKGQLKQEQHYYPYGLCIKGGEDLDEPNKFKFEGKLMQDELGLQLYDFHARQYDPQIGKFWSLDPLDEFPSGYTGMGNDPANLIDPTGMKTQTTYGSATVPELGGLDSSDPDFITEEEAEKTAALGNGRKGASGAATGAENEEGLEGIKNGGALDEVVINSTAPSTPTLEPAKKQGFWGKVLDVFQIGLDIVGMIPVVGEAADLVNAGIYAARGDMVNAGLSLAATMPIIGNVATVGKYAKKAANIVDAGGKITKSTMKLGREMHKAYKAGLVDEANGLYKEYNKIKGIRPDFVDVNKRIIYELKPNNPRAIRDGERQLNRYKSAFEKEYGGDWKTVLDTY